MSLKIQNEGVGLMFRIGYRVCQNTCRRTYVSIFPIIKFHDFLLKSYWLQLKPVFATYFILLFPYNVPRLSLKASALEFDRI